MVADEDGKFYPYACAFDFEAMLKKIETEGNERNYRLYLSNVLVSVYVSCNVPDYDNKPFLSVIQNQKIN